MISEESFKLFSYVIKVGCWTKCLPFKWNPVTYGVDVIPHLNLWRIFAVVFLSVEWATVMVNGIPLVVSNERATPQDYIVFGFVAIGTAAAFAIQLHILFIPREWAACLSQVHLLSRKLGR